MTIPAPDLRYQVVLVTGGRDYADQRSVQQALDHLNPAEIWQGEYPTGADLLARQWARSRGVTLRSFPADWANHGKAGGPIRNTAMAKTLAAYAASWPDCRVAVLAFPGGRGTRDMVKTAKAHGLPVLFVNDVRLTVDPDGTIVRDPRPVWSA